MRYCRNILGLIGSVVIVVIVYTSLKLDQQVHFLDFHTEVKVYVQPLSQSNTLRFRGAPARNSSVLLDLEFLHLSNNYESLGIGNINGIPKIIHQSWKDEDLPIKFFEWSNTCRLKHPDWHWVLWTDEANAALVERHFPSMNETYWSVGGAIQRADLVRNVYLWAFGGVYMDLHMECLRPLDSVLSSPDDKVSLDYPISHLTNTTHFAYVGSMATNEEDWTSDHAIPNAFMASTPHHPLWLFPLSQVLDRYGADADGHIGAEGKTLWKYITAGIPRVMEGLESVTGPVALKSEQYREWKEDIVAGSEPVAKALTHLLALAPTTHEVIVLRPSIIYPYSWVGNANNAEGCDTYCRIFSADFEASVCHDKLKVYENGARTITYWSHTWSQVGKASDSTYVGS